MPDRVETAAEREPRRWKIYRKTNGPVRAALAKQTAVQGVDGPDTGDWAEVVEASELEKWIRRAIFAEEYLECLVEILNDRDDPLALERMRKRLGDTGPVYDAEFKIARELGSGVTGG